MVIKMRKSSQFVCFIAFFAIIFLNFAFFIPMVNLSCGAENRKKYSNAKAMAVIEQSSGRILFCENENEKLPMASTTKIITAIYVIENNNDLNKVVCIPKEAVGISGTSIGLKEGEHLTILELLYGLMLRSGNDSAVALAIETAGSVDKFISGVNEFLVKIGVTDTHICNPHGLTEEGHYTTASDLARITAYAMNNPVFKEIVSTKEKKISNELKSKYTRNLKNKNKLLVNYQYADGVKTGFTLKAGRCFVGSATKNNMQLICVLLNCVPMFEDCQALLEKGFDEYQLCHLIENGKTYNFIDEGKERFVVGDRDFYYPLSKTERQNISLSISKEEKECKKSKSQCTECVKMQINLGNQLIFSHKIYNINNIDESNSISGNFHKIVEKM